MTYKNLITKQDSAILLIKINREKQLNALNKETIENLHHCMLNAITDPKVKGIIITGAGEKAFVAGADIKEFTGLNKLEAVELARNGHQKLFDLIEKSPKPVI